MIETCVALKIAKKSIKPPILAFKAMQGHWNRRHRKPVYDFLLVINSNLGPISHRYWDTATYWPKIANFAHPLSFSALVRSDPLRIYEKVLRFLKLESSSSRWWRLGNPSLHRFWLIHPCDRQMDRQTDRIAMAKTRWNFARKKLTITIMKR